MAGVTDTGLDAMIARYEYGQEIAQTLSKLPTPWLKQKLLGMLSQQPEHIKNMVEVETSGVRKTFMDDQVEKMEVCYYDTLIISHAGISFKPEHGVPQLLIAFVAPFAL